MFVLLLNISSLLVLRPKVLKIFLEWYKFLPNSSVMPEKTQNRLILSKDQDRYSSPCCHIDCSMLSTFISSEVIHRRILGIRWFDTQTSKSFKFGNEVKAGMEIEYSQQTEDQGIQWSRLVFKLQRISSYFCPMMKIIYASITNYVRSPIFLITNLYLGICVEGLFYKIADLSSSYF